MHWIVQTSRPRFWMYIAGPYLVGFAYAAELNDFLNGFFILNFLFFLTVANLYIYGINDFFDFDTDKFNPKKRTKEHLLLVSQKKSLSHILIVSVAISVAILLIQPNAISQILILLFLTLATAYSAPPIRAKAHAIIDSTSNIFYVFPAFIAYTQLTNQLPPTPIIIAACLWPIAMHLYSAIPDITADTKAKLKTSAIVFGFNGSLIICAILWLTTLLLALQYGPQFFILGIYPILPLLLINKKEKDADKLYWYFPIINTIVGFLLCIYAIVI